MMINSLTRLGFHGGLFTHGADQMATHCRESGVPLTNVPGKVQKEFASKALQNKFNARRRERGSKLYDFLMSQWFGDRSQKILSEYQLEKRLDEMLTAWRDEDERDRDGRPSWNVPPKDEEKRT